MPTIHLAVFTQPLLDLILDGCKTIETRISKIKLPPYQAVSVGDYVLMKQSGGPIKGVFEVDKVETYSAEHKLDPDIFDTIYQEYALQIFGLCDVATMYHDVLRKKWCTAKYATFMSVKNVCQYDPVVSFKKTNRQAWIVLGSGVVEDWLDL